MGTQRLRVVVADGAWRCSINMSLNDVCVFFPAWFGAVATVLLGLLTWECTGSALAGAASGECAAVLWFCVCVRALIASPQPW